MKQLKIKQVIPWKSSKKSSKVIVKMKLRGINSIERKYNWIKMLEIKLKRGQLVSGYCYLYKGKMSTFLYMRKMASMWTA